MKAAPADFQVAEVPAVVPSGDGEHLWLRLRKTGLATPELAGWLARTYRVPAAAVGYAGMKDKHAVTEQWFSVHTPGNADVLPRHPDVQLLEAVRHRRKLRRGELAANRFQLRLTGVAGDRWPVRLADARDHGVPNYFGAQRFGHDNLAVARAWLAQRRRARVSAFRRGLYLSVLRSFLFNEVLGARVAAGTWQRLLPGDVAVPLPGVTPDTAVPSGPLWGRGRSAATAAALALEQSVLAPHQALCDGLEHAGLNQQRRSLVLRPAGLEWTVAGGVVQLAFQLPPGSYATALLSEVFELDVPAEAVA